MLQLKCNQLDQLKCNHCLPLLNQSKDTWFQAMAMRRTNWSWGFLMHSLRAGSECLHLWAGIFFQGWLADICPSRALGKAKERWLRVAAIQVAQMRTSGHCRVSPQTCASWQFCARPLPPPRHLLSHLLFTASFLFPIFSLIPTEGQNVLVSSWWYQHFCFECVHSSVLFPSGPHCPLLMVWMKSSSAFASFQLSCSRLSCLKILFVSKSQCCPIAAVAMCLCEWLVNSTNCR